MIRLKKLLRAGSITSFTRYIVSIPSEKLALLLYIDTSAAKYLLNIKRGGLVRWF